MTSRLPNSSPSSRASRGKKSTIAWAFALSMMVAALAAWAAWPVCVALPEEAVAGFHPPIAQRDDRVWHVRTFQQHEGQWQHCKPRIARAFFF